MLRGTHWLAGAALAALMTVTPALAASKTPPRLEAQVRVVLRPAQPLTALGAAPLPADARQPHSYQMTRATVGTLSNATLLPATSQAVGFQVSNADQGTWQRVGYWAAAGAAVGAIWGLIDDEPLEKALIGGVVGAGLSFVIKK